MFKRLIVYVLVILTWYMFVQSSEKTEWYVELYTKNNVTVKVRRDEYLEFKELWNVDYYTEKQRVNYYRTVLNESIYYTENYKMYRDSNQ